MKKLFCQIDKKKFKPKYFIVMGNHHNGKEWSPMTFDNEVKSFCWANPSEEYCPYESIEIYERETVMYLLGETIHTEDGTPGFQYRIVPIYMGFEFVHRLYMIMEDRGSQEPFAPLCRGEFAPLTWANTGRKDLPAPELFDIKTAQKAVTLQKEWEIENNIAPEDKMNMVIIPMQYQSTKISEDDHLAELNAQLVMR